MKIKYCGNSCFLFKAKKTKLITNPSDKGVKVNLKSIAPDIIVLSHPTKISSDSYYLISSPGEYEVKDIFVYGYLSDLKKQEDKKEDCSADIYMFDIENVHMSIIDKSVTRVRGSVLDEMGIVNVLFVSLASDSSMKLSKVVDLVNEIEPQIVVPMDYNKELLDKFSNAMGVKELEEVPELDVKRGDFSDEELPMRFVVIEK